jgi:hypothetical protein
MKIMGTDNFMLILHCFNEFAFEKKLLISTSGFAWFWKKEDFWSFVFTFKVELLLN